MMNTSTPTLRRCAALAGSLMLAAGATQPLLGSGERADLQIDAMAFAGNVLQVTVGNHGTTPAGGTVTVVVLLADGQQLAASAPVFVAAGETAVVSFTTPAPICGVLQAGVVLDDGSPF